MELTPYLVGKALVVPLVLFAYWAAIRGLPIQHPMRAFFERHGAHKIAIHVVLLLFAIGGAGLTIFYS